MRLHRFGIQPNMGPTGEVTHITVWYENRDDMTGDIMNGNFTASADDFVRIQNKEIAVEDIIKQKIAKLLDLNADADTELAIHELKTLITEKDTEIARLNDALMEMVLMISNLTMPDIDISELEEPVEEEEDGEIITDDSDMGIDPIDTDTEGGEGGE